MAVRRKLRKETTPAEQRLWSQIRRVQLEGLRFRRQFGIGPFIVDFYCPQARLAIEVDGPSHYEEGAQESDRSRQAFLERRGIRVLRFTNREVHEQIEGVLSAIQRALGDMSSQ
ncbi:MAG: endonuclease domain-containing protein [Acidobacteria bacterium]|nr:endonuclease domain-containing protein [Acidobacteriota bacterium]MCK6685091.1 endonuclease domain-containing protein [Thermoanaerobaculia bacterium]